MKKRARGATAMVAAAMLGACAPVTFAGGPALSVGVGSGMGVQFSACQGLLPYSPEGARLGIRTAAMQARAMQNRVAQLQARMSFGQAATSTESWKRIASGEC